MLILHFEGTGTHSGLLQNIQEVKKKKEKEYVQARHINSLRSV